MYAREQHAEETAVLLNNYVSFGLTDVESILTKIKKKEVFICSINEKVVGAFTFSRNFDYALYFENYPQLVQQIQKKNISSFGFLEQMAVETDFRRNGIGENLLAHVLEDNKQAFLLCGWAQNNHWEARSLVYKQGFHELLTLEDFWGDIYNACPACDGYCKCKAIVCINR